MAETAGTKGRRTPKFDEAEPGSEHATPRCPVTFCPICIAVTGTQPLSADVLRHLLNAGRELLMAARAAMSDRTDGGEHDPGPTRLEKIDLG